ncbi:hypothetical protein [Variovorax paradoxus]|uniref:hypothetical protein n=1 Tax=Variovorax paradoxus TaxID=34073 RepID=UPI0029C945E7|nr:hypothetical protein RZE77_22065 [Variovorax paradoxus]
MRSNRDKRRDYVMNDRDAHPWPELQMTKRSKRAVRRFCLHDDLALQVKAYWLLHVPPVVVVKSTLKSRFSVVRLIVLPKILGGNLKILSALLVMAGRHVSAMFFSLMSRSFTFSFIVHGRRPIAGERVGRHECQQDGERKSNHITPFNLLN